jgi:hypothetical protein
MDLFDIDFIGSALSAVATAFASAYELAASDEYLPFTMTVLLVGCLSFYKWRRSQSTVNP